METNPWIKLPFYAKAALLLIGLYTFTSILYITQDIILPLIYGAIIAISISPAVKFLVEKGVNRTLAIFAVLGLAMLLIAALIIFLITQASLVGEAWPQLLDKFEALLNETIAWVSGNFGISTSQINAWIAKSREQLLSKSGSAIGVTLTTVSGVLASLILTPVYTFMILYYQPHLIEFIYQLFGGAHDKKVSEILNETKGIVQGYLAGLFAEFAIVAVLNAVGLLVLGIQYAILLGIIGALLNVIPYLGGLIAMALFAVVALLTKSPIYVVYVIGLYTLIQLIDNNYIVPKIVGSKVKLNALVSIIVVIAGAALWGIPGMFLSIPLTAVVKLILDRIEPWKPWGFLLGDTMPNLGKLNLKFKKKAVKKTE